MQDVQEAQAEHVYDGLHCGIVASKKSTMWALRKSCSPGEAPVRKLSFGLWMCLQEQQCGMLGSPEALMNQLRGGLLWFLKALTATTMLTTMHA